GKWPGSHAFNVHFREWVAVVIADNDPLDKKGRRPGLAHAQDVARKISEYAKRVIVLTENELDLPSNKGDISDWLNNGHSAAELVRVSKSAREWIDPGEANAAPRSGKKPTDDELRDRWLRSVDPTVYARGDFWRYQVPHEAAGFVDGDGLWHDKGEWLI